MADQPNPPADEKPATTEANEDVRARAVAAAEAMDENTPTPTQEELDKAKLQLAPDTKGGTYKTRQAKA